MPEENVNLPGGLNEKTLKTIERYSLVLFLLFSIYINYKQSEQNSRVVDQLMELQERRIKESKENEALWRDSYFRTIQSDRDYGKVSNTIGDTVRNH